MVIGVACIYLANAVIANQANQRQLFAEIDSPRKVAASTNDHELFQNEDILKQSVFPASSVDDLRELRLVKRSMSNVIGPILIQRKGKHEKAIESKIEELQSSMEKCKRCFINLQNCSSAALMTQFVHGFDHILQMLRIQALGTEDNGGVCFLSLDEEERLSLKRQLFEIGELINDYTAKYDPIQQFLNGLGNTSQLYEFMTLQREAVALTTKLEAFCGRISHAMYEHALHNVWKVTGRLKLLMKSIGTKVGCPQIIHCPDPRPPNHIRHDWDWFDKYFKEWKSVDDFRPPFYINGYHPNEKERKLLKDSAVLIESLVALAAKIKKYALKHLLML